MNRPISPGIIALILLAAAGAWLVAAPFVLSIQPVGDHWLRSTVDDVATGGLLIVISLLGIVLHAAFGVRDLVSAATEAVAEETEPELSPTEQTG